MFQVITNSVSSQIFTWNTDAWGYGSGTTSLYQSHPWVLAILPSGEALGVLADTTRRCEVYFTFCFFLFLFFHGIFFSFAHNLCFLEVYDGCWPFLDLFVKHFKQIDLRNESTIKFISAAAYPVITFGPFASPTAVLISLSHATGYFLNPPAFVLIID